MNKIYGVSVPQTVLPLKKDFLRKFLKDQSYYPKFASGATLDERVDDLLMPELVSIIFENAEMRKRYMNWAQ